MNNIVKRLSYVDIAKGIGISLVVLGHTQFPLLRKVIYSFHMPLFFFISGYLCSQKKLELSFKEYLIKVVKNLYVPFLKFSLFYLIFNNIFVRIGILSYDNFYDINKYIKVFIDNLFFLSDSEFSGPFWFIRNLFIIEIVVYIYFFLIKKILCKYFSLKLHLITLLILITCGAITSHLRIIPTLSNMFLGLLFFLIGCLIRNSNESICENYFVTLTGVIAVIFLGNKVKVDMVVNYYSNIFIFLITGILGSIAIIHISKLIENFKYSKYISFLGKNSIYILCFHIISFKFILFINLLLKNESMTFLTGFIERYNSLPIYIYNPNTDFLLYFIGGIIIPLLIPIIKKYKLNLLS